MSLTVLDVGQGDATLIRTPSRRRLVIDVGPPGSTVVVDQLRRSGTRYVDALFLTHLHADHTGGLASMYDRLVIDSLFLPAGIQLPDSIRRVARNIRFLKAGDLVNIDREVAVRVLAPTGLEQDDDPNARSLVLRVDHGSTTMLLTGDAERASEEAMTLHWNEWLQADVVKVGHHGSRTSSAPFFVDRVRPGCAVVSVGLNSYGLPSDEVIRRWMNAGARVHITRRDGAFCLVSDGRSYRAGCTP